MNQLEKTLTSLEVSEMVGREHKEVLRDIRNIITQLGESKIAQSYFIESTYTNSQNREMPMFLLTKKGCELYSTRMTGEKGTQFAVAYIERFNEMENHIKQEKLPQLSQAELIAMMAQQNVEQEKAINNIKTEQETIKHRLDNIDSLDTVGDLQQRLNAMVRRYAQGKGIAFGLAWKEFRVAFNTAYRTNLKALVNNYEEKHNLKKLTTPQYLSLVDRLPDAIRVADKMLNKESV